MGHPARQLDTSASAGRRYNALPGWITHHQDFRRLKTVEFTLQGIADAPEAKRAEDGSLVGVFGGPELLERAGCSARTFWRHLTKLERLGFVVTLSRGGRFNGKEYASVYGIPGRPDALDRRRCRRERRRLVRCEDGSYRCQVLRPGEQPTLWHKRDWDKSVATPVPTCHNPCVNVAQPPVSTWHTLKNGYEKKNDHGGVSKHERERPRGEVGHPVLHAIRVRDLRDTGRLLALFDQAVRRGYVEHSEHDRMTFAAMAAHALRRGNDPPALFVANVKHKRGHHIAQEDEEAARRRLAEYFRGTLRPGERTTPADRLGRTEILEDRA